LRILVLQDCPLTDLPVEVGELRRLVRVVLVDCRCLVKMPETIRNWELLERLVLRGCVMLSEIPEMIGCRSLEHLDLSLCESLVGLPNCARFWRLKVGFQILLEGCSQQLQDEWSSL
jgi:hypothetical protein